MKLKKILACAMAGAMVLGSLSVVSASDSLTGSGWWTDCQTSTAVSLEDGESVSFKVEISSDSLETGDYAAFCVEANDGANYFTATSDGDCWGAGTDTDATSTGVVIGGSYMVTISRSGNNFTADIVDYDTGASILANEMYLEGTSEFGTTTCYIMTQVGNLEVSEIVTDSLTGSGWWTDCQTSTAVSLADGETVSFTVEITSDSIDDGEYAAFCVEANDGASYFTGTSDGDCWGAGTDTDGTSTGAVVGGSYTVTITRSGNNFTADIVDNSTGSSILSNPMYLEGNVDFGTTTCYIMTQVGNLTVSNPAIAVAAAADDSSDDDDTTDDDSTSDDDNTSDDDSTSDDSTTGDDSSDDDSDVSYTTVVDTVELEDLTAEDFWTVFTEGLELVEGQQIVITGTTTNNGTENWNNALFILYSSDDAAIYAAGTEEATAANYVEYFVGRLDDFGWGTAAYEVTSYPDDWDAWLAATQAGAEFTITVTYVDGVIQVVSSCEGAEYVMTYTVEDSAAAYYVALTGEYCTLTDLVATYYEADEDSIIDTPGDDSSDDSGSTSDVSTGSDDEEEEVAETTITNDTETLTADGNWWSVHSTYLTATSKTATWTFTVTVDELDDSVDTNVFSVELQDANGNYITTSSDGTAWYAYATGDDIVITGSAIELEEGATYTVTIVRDGDDFTITYLDEEGNELLSFYCGNTNLSSETSAYTYAQVGGTYTIDATVTYGTATDDDEDSDDEDSDDEDSDDEDSDDENSDDEDSDANDDGDSNTSDGDDSSSSTSTKKTSDASAAAPIVIALLGCAVVALASKRRMA